MAAIVQGRALTDVGRIDEGIARMRQGLADHRRTGADIGSTYWLFLLAEVYERNRQHENGTKVMAEAFTLIEKGGERVCESDLHRAKGVLILRTQARVISRRSKIFSLPQSPTRDIHEKEAESCFLKAIEVSQRQQAKSLELRATMSLARLWQQQGKQKQAHEMLAEVYNWFTEGFDTKDLQEAKILIEELRQ